MRPPTTHRSGERTLGAATALLVWAACTAGGRGPQPGELRGTVLGEPWEKPGFTLTSTAGEAFDFRHETDGYVTLLFFGYTHCPDVCPVHMANIGTVLGRLPPDVASRIKVVFVTTDPARDTPQRLRAWLNGFDPRFVGLLGPLDTVNAIQRRLGLAPAVRQDASDGGSDYAVGHAAQVIAFTTDDRARVVYPFGTRQADWAHDLPILVRTDWRRVLPTPRRSP